MFYGSGSMSENDKSDDEINREIGEMLAQVEKKNKWLVCKLNGIAILVPDTRKALPEDVYGVSELECSVPDPDLIVKAWPLKFIWNNRAKEMFMKTLKYSDVDFNTLSLAPGIINDNHVLLGSQVLK